MRTRLYLNHVPELDKLVALEFGRIDEDQPPASWHPIGEQFAYHSYLLLPGPPVGFVVHGFSTFDAEDPTVSRIWNEPLFDVPVLGLAGASAGEIIVAARTHFQGEQSINRALFRAALAEDPPEAEPLWRACLEAGDSMAHFGLGYTLYDLGRYQEAYRHLRHYTEIGPHGSWTWCWFGKAAEKIGEAR